MKIGYKTKEALTPVFSRGLKIKADYIIFLYKNLSPS